ncbi:MAG: ATP-binding cassette domain-containing protein, partial [Rhodocyclaceae bacterium]|nr:ATP-binding cassette domain-containing protein [Rhodocyclaceae bacterium]
MRPLLEVIALKKHFGGVWASAGVDLAIAENELHALIGPNGAGKTTTVRMLTALISPTRGWARVAGYDVVKQPQE